MISLNSPISTALGNEQVFELEKPPKGARAADTMNAPSFIRDASPVGRAKTDKPYTFQTPAHFLGWIDSGKGTEER